MEGTSDRNAGTNSETTVSSTVTCSEGEKEQTSGRTKVAFSEQTAEKSKDSGTESQAAAAMTTSTRKSGWPPMQRRGSRKQTLSLNPEEREALENLIEEVLLDGMGDGAADSDGSSSDSDDAGENPSSLESGSATAIKVADIAAKLSSLGATSGSTGNKKYYPGQLKVALKHMSNLPPRFVRKLAKAQQYLDAATTAKVLSHPTPIVGGIEEEEESGAQAAVSGPVSSTVSASQHAHGTDDLRPGVSTPHQAHSPTFAQQDRMKMKETKLLEAKKQIRTLLNDRDQYVDEKSATTVVSLSVSSSSAEVPGILTSTLNAGGEAFSQGASSPARISSVTAGTVVVAAVHDASQTSNVPLRIVAPASTYSADVSEYQLLYAPLPQGYTTTVSASTPQMHNFSMPPPNVVPSGQMLQTDGVYARQFQPRATSQGPDYAQTAPVIQGHPQAPSAATVGYYAIPSIYNTPPPPLPPGTSLVAPPQVASISQSESFGLHDAQYQIPMYSGSSPPFQQNPQPPQQLPSAVYVSYSGSSYGAAPVAAYQLPVASQVTPSYSLSSPAKSVAPFPFGLQQQPTAASPFPTTDIYQLPPGALASQPPQQNVMPAARHTDFGSQPRYSSPGIGGQWHLRDQQHHHRQASPRSHHGTPTVRFSTPKDSVTAAPRSRHSSESRHQHQHVSDAGLPVSGHLPPHSKRATASSSSSSPQAGLTNTTVPSAAMQQPRVNNSTACSISDILVPSEVTSSNTVTFTQANGTSRSLKRNADARMSEAGSTTEKAGTANSSGNRNICLSCGRPYCHFDLSSSVADISSPGVSSVPMSKDTPTSMTVAVSRNFVQQLSRIYGRNENAIQLNGSGFFYCYFLLYIQF